MYTKSILWSIFVLILIYFLFNGLDASVVVTYYLKSGFNGKSTSLRMERGVCYNLIDSYDNDRMKSIEPGKNCVELYTGSNCRRTVLRVAPGTSCHTDLSNCRMSNTVSSLKLC